MRESIGGAWLLGIAVTIISLFTAYLAFSVNYSKAFKVKDGIVERIEKYEGFSETNTRSGRSSSNVVDEIQDFLNMISYNTQGKCTEAIGVAKPFYANNGTTHLKDNRSMKSTYCIERVTKAGTNGDYSSAYYKVTVFYGFDLGFIDLNSVFFLSGETKNIYYPKDESYWN